MTDLRSDIALDFVKFQMDFFLEHRRYPKDSDMYRPDGSLVFVSPENLKRVRAEKKWLRGILGIVEEETDD